MALHVPPVADETDAIAAFLGQSQDAFRALLHGLTPRQASSSPSASSLSLGGLVRHVTAVQHSWLASAEAAPGEVTQHPDGVDDYLEGFRFREADSLEDLLAGFDQVSAAVLDAVRRLDLDTPVPVPDAPWFPKDVKAWSVRWVWWHLVEELTRHAGHGDIIRETVDGGTMYSLVAARDGLPDLPFLPAWKPVEPPFTTGVSTVRLHAGDLSAARAWYADLLGAEPQVVRDEYVEWRVGPHGQELGVLDARFAPTAVSSSPAGTLTYWQVDDVDAALADLVGRGATVHEGVRDLGGGHRDAVVIDPFGNALGLRQDPSDTSPGRGTDAA